MREIPELRSLTSWTYETPKTKWAMVSTPSTHRRFPYGKLVSEFHCKHINFIGTDKKWHKMEEVMDFGRNWWQLKKPLGYDDILPSEFVFKNIANGIKVYLPQYVGNKVPLLVNVDNITVYPDPHPETTTVDGEAYQSYASGSGVDWATIIAAPGSTSSDAVTGTEIIYISGDTVTDRWDWLQRAFFLFDISSLAGNTISAVTFSLYGYGKADYGTAIMPDISVYSSAPASNTAIVAGDFDSIGNDAYCDTPITFADFSTSGYNDFLFNANPGILAAQTAVDGDGILKLGTKNANYDASEIAPTWSNATHYMRAYQAEQANTIQDPKLYVEYEMAIKIGPFPTFFKQ